jgi:hypothetical protein
MPTACAEALRFPHGDDAIEPTAKRAVPFQAGSGGEMGSVIARKGHLPLPFWFESKMVSPDRLCMGSQSAARNPDKGMTDLQFLQVRCHIVATHNKFLPDLPQAVGEAKKG